MTENNSVDKQNGEKGDSFVNEPSFSQTVEQGTLDSVEKETNVQTDKQSSFDPLLKVTIPQVPVGQGESVPIDNPAMWVKWAYELEEKLDQRLNTQANHMFLVSSILSAIVLGATKVLLELDEWPSDTIKGYAGLCIFGLLCSMICAIYSLLPSIGLDCSKDISLFRSVEYERDKPNNVFFRKNRTEKEIIDQLFFMRNIRRNINLERVKYLKWTVHLILYVVIVMLACCVHIGFSL